MAIAVDVVDASDGGPELVERGVVVGIRRWTLPGCGIGRLFTGIAAGPVGRGHDVLGVRCVAQRRVGDRQFAWKQYRTTWKEDQHQQ